MPNAKVVKPLFKNPSRQPEGVTTVYREDIKGKFGQPDPTQWAVDFCDFNLGDLANKWAAAVTTGTGTAAQIAGDGGQVSIVGSATNGEQTSLVKTAAVGQNYVFAANRSIIFETKFSVDDATNAGPAMGLINTALTPFTYTAGFVLRKTPASGQWVFESKGAGTSTFNLSTTQFPAFVASTQITAGFAYKGVQTLINGVVQYEFLVQIDYNDGNGPRQASCVVPSTSVTASALGEGIGGSNGTAAARTMNIDYVFGAKDRFYQ